MSFVLEGTINGMRPVTGETTQGKNKGSYWHFLSMEVCDSRFGQVYSCQLRSGDKDLFQKFVKIEPGKDQNGKTIEKSTLLQDLTGHNVRLLIKGVSGGLRNIEDKDSGTEKEIIQIRFYVGGLKDLGLPKTDDF